MTTESAEFAENWPDEKAGLQPPQFSLPSMNSVSSVAGGSLFSRLRRRSPARCLVNEPIP